MTQEALHDKLQFTPQRSLRWMRKGVDLAGRRIAPAPSAVAAVVTAWVRLALRPYMYVALRRFSVMGRPGNLGCYFLARAQSWLRWALGWAWRTPQAVVRGLCKVIAMGYRVWEPEAMHV